MLPLTLLLAMDEPPPTELATVSFSANGQYALVETRWVLDGPGFPVARVEVFALSTGKHVLDRQVELREGAASAGPIGATAQAREQYSAELAAFGLPGGEAVAAGCEGNRCGGSAGCTPGGTKVLVATTPANGEICPEQWQGEVATVSVNGRVANIDAPRTSCSRAFAATNLYSIGSAGVLILSYEMPGHEGPATRFVALAGSFD